MLVNSDTILIKLYFMVSKEEQAKRFKKRATDPLKTYKLSPIDRYAQEYWDKYTVAEYSMFLASHTEYAPWTIIDSNNKKKARINAIKHILNQIDYPDKLDAKKLQPDPKVVLSVEDKLQELSSLDISKD